jgi:SAM-dependent methyltransferase
MKPILDACCGSRMFWFDKENPNVVFGDIREESHTLCDGRRLDIAPDVKMDFKAMPFAAESFSLVVFDPPHIKGAGKNGWQAKKYGSLGANWKEEIRKGFDECMRVLKPNGVLIFKWNEQSLKVSEVIKVIGRTPLFGHRTMQNNKTIWMAFMKGIE